jgi:hypothetical protein
MDTRRSASLAIALTALSVAVPAAAGLQTGAYCSWTNTAGSGFLDDSDYGSTYGNYAASVTGATANLGWYATTSTFTGSAGGGDGITSQTRGVSLMTLGGESTFAISFGMSQVVAAGNQVGWGLVDASTGETVFGLSFDGLDAIAAGGVATSPDGSFSGTVAAGSYWLVMLAECTAEGGLIAYDATFTPVPAPGAFALLSAIPFAGMRRRRR